MFEVPKSYNTVEKKMSNDYAPIKIESGKMWLRLAHKTSILNESSIRRNGILPYSEDTIRAIISNLSRNMTPPLSSEELHEVYESSLGLSYRRERGSSVHACASWGRGLSSVLDDKIAAAGGELYVSIVQAISKLRDLKMPSSSKNDACLILFQVAFSLNDFECEFSIKINSEAEQKSSSLFQEFIQGIISNRKLLATRSTLDMDIDYIQNTIGSSFFLDEIDDIQINEAIPPERIIAFTNKKDLGGIRERNKTRFLIDL
jgi:hypothetical protein